MSDQLPCICLSPDQDDADIRAKYRPFLQHPQPEVPDWVADLELDTATAMVRDDLAKTGSRLKVLVLYGSLRKRSEIISFGTGHDHEDQQLTPP